MEASRGQYRPDVDGLRAVAILAVALFHAWPKAMPGGFVGVDVFFVISGFLITAIIRRDLVEGTFSFAAFYARRIRRIFPALIVVLLVTLTLGWIILIGGEYRALGRHVGAGAGFLSNGLLWSEAGYFDLAAEQKPLLHLWSLGVEEQFYLLWPLLLFFAHRRHWDFRLVVAGVALASFAANVIEVRTDPTSAFYLPQYRFWELMLGAGLAAAPSRAAHKGAIPDVLALAGAALVAFALIVVNSDRGYPGLWALLPTLGAACLLAAGPTAVVNRRILASRPMVWLGIRSYPLYLWHWPLLSFVDRYIGSDKTIALVKYRGLALLAALALAWATHALIESGVRRAFGHRPRLVVASLCAIMIALGCAGLGHWPAQSSTSALVALAKLDAFAAARHSASWREKRCFFVPGDVPDESAAFLRNGCDGGPTPRRPLILLVGDSHAADLYPGLAAVLGARYEIGQLTVGFCAPLIKDPIGLGNMVTSERCRKDEAFVFARIAAQKPDLIVASAHFLDYEERPGYRYPDYDRAAVAGLREMQRVSGAFILVVGQSPAWTRAFPNILGERLRSRGGPIPESGDFGLDKRIFATDARLRAIDWGDHIAYVSLVDALCPKGACRLIVGGEFPENLIAFDANHFTDNGSRYVAETILKPRIETRVSAVAQH